MNERRVPVIHLTDLYHPPQDPDDVVDLATLHALPELEIRAVVLDPTRRFLLARSDGGADIAREPGLEPVRRLQRLSGITYPVGVGPADPLANPGDRGGDGAEFLLRELERAPSPVVVSVVSSLRPLAAAYNRDSALCHQKIARVVVNAGNSAPGAEAEWNVVLDPHAYVALWRSGLPVDWYPCTGAAGSFATEEHNTYWAADQRTLLDGLPEKLAAWFEVSLGAEARAERVRNMWSTASLARIAGRTLTPTTDGWRFACAATDSEPLTELWPVEVSVTDEGDTVWWPAPGSRHRLFARRTDVDYAAVMTEALHALLAEAAWEG